MPSLIVGVLLAAFAAGAQQPTTRVIGRVVDAQTNDPLAAAVISFIPWDAASRQVRRTAPLRTETDGRGVFTMNLPPGRYRTQLQRPGFISSEAIITIDGGSVMLPDARLTRGGSIEGRILGINGRPVQGVSVFAVRPATGVMREAVQNLAFGRNALTDDRGHFRLTSLPQGTYYVVAQAAAGQPFDVHTQMAPRTIVVETFYPGVADIATANPIEVTVGNTTTGVDFQMQQATTVLVSGIVVDHEDRPVAGARVMVNSPRSIPLSSPSVNAQRDGTFQLALPPGTYRLLAGVQNADGSVGFFVAPGLGTEVVVGREPVSGVKVVPGRR